MTSAYPTPIDDLLPRAQQMAADLGQVPSRNRLMRELGIGAKKASTLRAVLAVDTGLPAGPVSDPEPAPRLYVLDSVDPGEELRAAVAELAERLGFFPSHARVCAELGATPADAQQAISALESADYVLQFDTRETDAAYASRTPVPSRASGDHENPATALVSTAVNPEPTTPARPAAARVAPTPVQRLRGWFRRTETTAPANPAPGSRRRVRSWPVLLLAAPAFVAIWGGWVGLGKLTGFGPVDLLPGIAGGFVINSAITLPIGVEAYAAYALRVWLSGATRSAKARRFAKWSAIGSLLLGMAGQGAYHLMTAAGMDKAPWQITALVSCLPVVVLGCGAALAHLLHQDEEGDTP